MGLLNESVDARDYQKNITKAALTKNTLVVIPTGMGKTMISVMVGATRLENFPDSKILIMAPTRPLNAQHKQSFEEMTNVPKDEIVLVTGKIPPSQRQEIYNGARIIIATPQTIENDLKSEKLNLENFSFVTFDESHRAMKDYAYSYIAKKFMNQSQFPLILGLTASPGGTELKINEICSNLFIRAVEVRTESDTDVEEYVRSNENDITYVDFPHEFRKIRNLLQGILNEDMLWLRDRHYVPTLLPSRTMLLSLQNRMSAKYSSTKNFVYIWPLMRASEAIKLSHAIELIEIQGIPLLYEYIEKLKESKKKTDKRLLKHRNMAEAIELIEKYNDEGLVHPKFDKLMEIVKDVMEKKPDSKIIVFANLRTTVETIKNKLVKNGIPADVLVGQSMKNGSGMTQDKQVEALQRFREGKFNVLCGTSVSEEGIDIPSVDYAIFYESVPSEIRVIQRRGRVGRQVAGKTVFLITRDTRDEAYFFASLNKEKKMHKVLKNIQKSKTLERKRTLIEWTK